MKRIQALISKEFLQLSRDPRLVGFIVIMPLVLLVLFGVALKLEPENVAMAVLDEDRSFFSDLIKTNVWSEGYFRLYDVPDRATLLRDIREGRARAGLHIGKDFSAQLTENNQPVVTLLVDGTMPSLATAMDNQSGAIIDERVTSNMYFLDADADNVIIAPDPFRLEVETLFNPDKNEAWFFLPGIIGVLIMQIALILTSTAIVREREEGTLEQLIVSPIRRWEFIAGKTLPYVAIAFVDFYAVLAVGWLGFGLPAPVSHSLLLLLGLLYGFGLVGLGLALQQGDALGAATSRATNLALSAFLGWALARELDPDDVSSATLTATAAPILTWLVGPTSVAAMATLLILTRLIARTTGKAPTLFDLGVLVVLAVWASRSLLGWLLALGLSFAVARDVRLPGSTSRLQLIAALVIGFASTISLALSTPAPELDWTIPLLAFTAIALVGGATLRINRPPTSTGDLTRAPLHTTRIRSARRHAFVLTTAACLILGASAAIGLLPALAAFSTTRLRQQLAN